MSTRTLLRRLGQGDRDALDALFPLVYEELSAAARALLRRASEQVTLDTTSLVHETYLKLASQRRLRANDRRHFLALAGITMRRIIVSHARARCRDKRGGGRRPVSLTAAPGLFTPERADELLALDEALERLAAIDRRAARVIECRYFAGLSIEDTATALGVSPATVKRDWQLARAWLARDLRDEAG